MGLLPHESGRVKFEHVDCGLPRRSNKRSVMLPPVYFVYLQGRFQCVRVRASDEKYCNQHYGRAVAGSCLNSYRIKQFKRLVCDLLFSAPDSKWKLTHGTCAMWVCRCTAPSLGIVLTIVEEENTPLVAGKV